MRIPPRRQLVLAGVVVVAIISTVLIAGAAKSDPAPTTASWVGSWAMAPTAAAPGTPAVPATATTPATKAVPSVSMDGFSNKTIRMTVHMSVGGSAVRVRLSNEFGTKALTIGHVTVAIPTKSGSGEVVPGTMHEVQFGGLSTASIPRGGDLFSDPVAKPDTDLAVSIWLPAATGPATFHVTGRSTTWIGSGDHSEDISNGGLSTKDPSWYYLTGVDVRNSTAAGTVVVLGDSVSDGFTATVDADHRWPDRLADRLGALPAKDHAPGVLDLGTAGSSLGHDGSEIGVPQLGPSSTARLDNDVFAQTGVRVVIVELSINDIWIFHDGPDQLIAELRQIATQVHEHGLRVYVSTVSPWGGYKPYYTPALDKTRLGVNAYIRSTSDFDGYIDFDTLLRDPETPTQLKPTWNSGDGIHPNDAGYLAMANAVPLKFLLP